MSQGVKVSWHGNFKCLTTLTAPSSTPGMLCTPVHLPRLADPGERDRVAIPRQKRQMAAPASSRDGRLFVSIGL